MIQISYIIIINIRNRIMALSDAKMILPRHEFTSGVTTNYDPGEKGPAVMFRRRKMTRGIISMPERHDHFSP